jgi:peptidoglycan/LPS O-acetylase OafA/YrhL
MVAAFVIFRSSWAESYFSVLGASLPFSIGATLYHLLRRPEVLRLLRGAERWLTVILIIGGVALVFIMEKASRAFSDKDTTLMVNWAYAGILPTALIVATLFQLKWRRIAGWDDLIGRFSYPIYLLQFAVAWFLGNVYGVTNVWILLATMFALSAILLLLVDMPVQRVRRRVRDGRDPMGVARAASSDRSNAGV